MHSLAFTTRHWGTGSSVSLSLVLLGFLGRGSQVSGQEQAEHPFIEADDIKAETCLRCHPKKEAKFVHTAVGMGCENCHRAVSENSKTTITLLATGGELCAMCHEMKKDPILHGPYKTGQCLVCHDPHAGDYKAQTRAPVNTLCFSCHGENAPNVKVNTETKLVAMPGNQVISLEVYRQAPKLRLDPSGTSGHPVAGHPLTGKDPHRKDGALSCLSCHDPHSSALPKLIPAVVKSQADLCSECHRQGVGQ